MQDANLFWHDRTLFVTYRNGKRFGHRMQLLNRLHVVVNGSVLDVSVRASQTVKVCCGRNIGFISTVAASTVAPPLLAIVWLSPLQLLEVERELACRHLLTGNRCRQHCSQETFPY